MKNTALSLACVLAAATFAQEASAVPVFARQTGMACTACHFQHFPLLNGFGRSFKASGYTLMGSQGKVEGEDLSIPDRLNLGVLATAGYETRGATPDQATPYAAPVAPATPVPGPAALPTGLQPASNNWLMPTNGGELSIFFGGKVTDNSGFLSELAMKGGVATPTAKLLILPEVGKNTRVGVAIYSISQGPAGSFELLNTGATSIHRLMGNPGAGGEHLMATSARQFVAPEGIIAANTAILPVNAAAAAMVPVPGATGLSLVVVNPDVGFLNISKYASLGPGSMIGAGSLPGTYVRAAGFFDVAGFDSAVGIQNFSGVQNPSVAPATYMGLGEEKATIVDAQFQGEVKGMGLGVYVSYGKAPGTADSVWNNCAAPLICGDKTSFNIAADLGIVPKVTLQAALRSGSVPDGAGGSQGDNAIMFGVAYELAMNQHLSLHHTAQSGSAWTATGVNKWLLGKNTTTFLLEQLF